MKKPPETAYPAFVDRIEGDTAVLLLGEDGKQTLNLPRASLPPGAAEGSYLQLRLALDPQGRARAEKEVADLMADLLGGEAPEAPGAPGAPEEPGRGDQGSRL